MGMYADVLGKLDDGLFVKITPGTPVRLRLLAHPRVSQKSFMDSRTGEVNISTRFIWPVWDYAQERLRILEQGKSIFEGVAAAVEAWTGGEVMPSLFDIQITRVGTSKNDSKYTVTPLPGLGTMPDGNTLTPPEGFKEKLVGTPLSQILEGVKPEVIGLGSGSSSPDLAISTPTHVDADALGSGEHDRLPTEEDVARAFKTSDIPF